MSIPESEPWVELLQHARRALATLDADWLEELAKRAEYLRGATMKSTSMRQWAAKPQRRAGLGVTHECSLLGELIHASERNLKVLRTTREGMRDEGPIANVGPRWVR